MLSSAPAPWKQLLRPKEAVALRSEVLSDIWHVAGDSGVGCRTVPKNVGQLAGMQ